MSFDSSYRFDENVCEVVMCHTHNKYLRVLPGCQIDGNGAGGLNSRWIIHLIHGSNHCCRLQNKRSGKYLRFHPNYKQNGKLIITATGATGTWSKLKVHYDLKHELVKFESAQWMQQFIAMDDDLKLCAGNGDAACVFKIFCQPSIHSLLGGIHLSNNCNNSQNNMTYQKNQSATCVSINQCLNSSSKIDNPEAYLCMNCKGNGWYHQSPMHHNTPITQKCFFCSDCPKCNGSGKN